MRKFLEFVVGQLVDRPEEAVWREETRGDLTAYFLEIPSSEIGKVIGKQGHTIQAIRNLLGAAVAPQQKRCSFDIVEPDPLR